MTANPPTGYVFWKWTVSNSGLNLGNNYTQTTSVTNTCSSLCSPVITASYVPGNDTTASPIKHIVIIMQENHAFDNFFGNFPGLSGPPFSLNKSVCLYGDELTQTAPAGQPFLEVHNGSIFNDSGFPYRIDIDKDTYGHKGGSISPHGNNYEQVTVTRITYKNSTNKYETVYLSSGLIHPHALGEPVGQVGQYVSPWQADSASGPVKVGYPSQALQNWDLPHEFKSTENSVDNLSNSWANMTDGGYAASITAGCCGQGSKQIRNMTIANFTMGYYSNYTIPDYWDLASYYSLDAAFFSSVVTYSYPNHLYAFSAQANNAAQCTTGLSFAYGSGCKPAVWFNLTTTNLATILDPVHASWKYYMGNWNDAGDCKNYNSTINPDYNGWSNLWGVVIDWPSLIGPNQPDCHNALSTQDLISNISNGYLPNAAFVEPNKSVSDHPNSGNLTLGQEYVSQILDMIGSRPWLWNDTAIFLTWDDFGGYYDGYSPTIVDNFGFSVRVPLIIISPYSIQGNISYGDKKQSAYNHT
jgi:phospholipase C